MKIHFICKKPTGYGIPAGLFNSAQFVANALRELGHQTRIDLAVDGNCIDRLVTEYDPDVVILEAIWCPPEKVAELLKIKRHARRRWIVRVHSKMPFLSQEGIAIEWIRRYAKIHGLVISPNSQSLCDDFASALGIRSTLLPNIYRPSVPNEDAVRFKTDLFQSDPDVFDIGCFGAVRPLKNQLEQAVSAIAFGDQRDRAVRFHINGGRVESRGEEALKSMRAMFKGQCHQLVEHGWEDHADFIGLVHTMHLGMQVSFSESFNIVAADFVHCGIPIVVSPDIEWMPWLYKCSPNSSKAMVSALNFAWNGRRVGLQHTATMALNRHNEDALWRWNDLLD